MIEYKEREAGQHSSSHYGDSNSWVLVNNNVKPDQVRDQAGFLILDLSPETRYTLKMTAHNAAGSTVREYEFTTLTFTGATIAPELIIHSDYGGFLSLGNPAVMLPLFISVTALTVAVILAAHHFRKKWHGDRGTVVAKNNFPHFIQNLHLSFLQAFPTPSRVNAAAWA